MSDEKAPEIRLELRSSIDRPLKPISSNELFGRAPVLLCASDARSWCEAAHAVRARLGDKPLDIYRVGSKGLRDPEGRFAAAYGIEPTGAVLVSPAGTIAWRAKSRSANPEADLLAALGVEQPRSAAAESEPATRTDERAAQSRTEAPPAAKAEVITAIAPAGRTQALPRPIADQDNRTRAPAGSTEGFFNPYARRVCAAQSPAGMTLYMHPVSVTSRPIRLFAAESGIRLNERLVDLPKDEHRGPDYARLNPSQMVPMLEDGDLRLTESSAILKYLADKAGSPAYPADRKRRAKVDEMMDWLNTQFYRDWAFNLCFPQLLPHHKRRSDEAHAATIEWGRNNSRRWLQVLNDHWIDNNDYLVGNEITIADYFGAGLVSLGEAIHTDFGKYPNVARWLGNMKKLKSWEPVNEAFGGLVASTRGKTFETV